MINKKEWKYFLFSDIFEFERGKRLIREEQIAGNIAYISSTKNNHGIDNYIDPPESHKIYKNKLTLSNSGSVGYLFYHDYEFVASDHVTVIDIKDKNIELNEFIALFLKPIIESIRYKYSFAREISNTRLFKESILLPVNDNGNPDWLSIEEYIQQIRVNLNLDINLKKNYPSVNLNTDNWDYFNLGGKNGLFDILKGDAIINNMKYGEFLVISSSKFNNGFNSFKDNGEYTIFEGNVITVASNGSVGKSFYQKDNFIATGDINILKLKNYELNKYIAMFLCTIIEKERYRSSYGRKWGDIKMKSSKIKLPCKNKKPDWSFMENYIKSLNYSDYL